MVDDAADRPRLPRLLLRHPAGRRHTRADLPAGAPGADRGPPQAPRAHPRQRPGRLHRHRAAGEDGGGAAARPGAEPGRDRHAAGIDSRRAAAAVSRPGRRHRLPAIHLRQHRRPEGRGADARQPAGQPARHGAGLPGQQRGRLRLLAAAVPRHGPDRRLVRLALLRHAAGADVAAGLPRPPGALAAGHLAPPRHPHGGAQLRLRAVRQEARRRRPGRPRPVARCAWR
jgi:hypothetical protein